MQIFVQVCFLIEYDRVENVRKRLMLSFRLLNIEQPGKRAFLKRRKLFVSEFSVEKNIPMIIILVEAATGRRNISFQHVLTLPHSRPGSQVCFLKDKSLASSIFRLVFLRCASFIIR